jgi:CheY-like chemotaxis protein
MSGPGRTLNVLVVDDSAVVRQTLTAILSQEVDFRVSAAADALIAQNKIARERPDVIVLDLEMPRMDGLTFLRAQMATDPIPVVVCSVPHGGGRGARDARPRGRRALDRHQAPDRRARVPVRIGGRSRGRRARGGLGPADRTSAGSAPARRAAGRGRPARLGLTGPRAWTREGAPR